MAKSFTHLDALFAERDFERQGAQDVDFHILLDNGLRLLISFTASSKGVPGEVSTQPLMTVTIPSLGKIDKKFTEFSSFRSLPKPLFRAWIGRSTSWPQKGGYGWIGRSRLVEKAEMGPKWRELLPQVFDDSSHAIELFESAEDYRLVFEEDPRWGWAGYPYSRVLAALHLEQWDDAVSEVEKMTAQDINPSEVEPKNGQWTVDEELENARQVVHAYVEKHRK